MVWTCYFINVDELRNTRLRHFLGYFRSLGKLGCTSG